MIYAITKNGQKVTIPSLDVAMGASYAGCEIHLTSSYAIPPMATVTDRTLVMDRGAVGIISDSITIACPVVMMPGSSFTLIGDLTLTGSFSASDDVHFTGDGALTGLKEARPEWFGANTVPGTTDMTAAMTAAHNSGALVKYSKGSYKFTGENLDFTGGIEVDPETVFTNGIYDGIIQFDRSGALIGLMHNHMEEKATADTVTPAITSGNIVAPPISRTTTRAPVDIIAYWYQDFGLDAARTTAIGAHTWYTWEWNHTDAVEDLGATYIKRGYLPNRHPLLGWYRGDDQNVLDWQCYWLREAGVSAVVVMSRSGYSQLGGDWATTSGIDNWIYKLLYNVPNGAGLGIIPGVSYGSYGANYGNEIALAAIATAWDNNVSIIHEAGRAYTVTNGGKKYITVYVWDSASLRGDFDYYNGSVNLAAFFAARGTYAKTLGYDGIAIMSRNAVSNNLLNRGGLLTHSVLYFGGTYVTSSSEGGDTYGDAVTAWNHTLELASVPAVPTEQLSSGHPSNWTQTGSTPELFQKMLSKAIAFARKTHACPNIVTIYNVSEWAEGGAALQPTLGAGWKYLDAIRSALTTTVSPEVLLTKMIAFYLPTSAIPIVAPLIGIGYDFSLTFSFTPILAAGEYDGQTVTIVNYDPVPAKTITLPDDRVLAGSTLFFRDGVNRPLAPWATVTLTWISVKGWVEL